MLAVTPNRMAPGINSRAGDALWASSPENDSMEYVKEP
jgi:hypothetical protein